MVLFFLFKMCALSDFQGNKVIARISPVSIASSLKVKDLNRMFAELPSLGDDAGVFAKDLEDIRKQIPLEKTQWD
ncbi:antitoxin of toxin-antitoxin system VapB [Desulfotignum phosphitoxidans DSM 13687]|uniref:Antitoxin of toxin-antitoxin system VapB n=1 Tax=Desulfotignum phosphitoxidans DSM 13687 TaxID=1286635 RepID=S0FTC0_9BACT|nr:antitoxin of toxin-antitoxin system VapB [Desulfotignum phosphitoxidans DSM 13687]